MKELLEAGVPIPICRAVIEQAGNATGNDAQQVIIRQQKALCLMTLVLYDIRMTIPRIGPDLDRIIQKAIDNAGIADQLAERLEREKTKADRIKALMAKRAASFQKSRELRGKATRGIYDEHYVAFQLEITEVTQKRATNARNQ